MSNVNIPFTGAFPGDRKVHILNGVDYSTVETAMASPIAADLAAVVPGKVATLSAVGQFTLGLGANANVPVWFVKSDVGEDAGGGSQANAPLAGYQSVNGIKLALYRAKLGVSIMVPAASYVSGTYAYGTELTVVTPADADDPLYAQRGMFTAATTGKIVIARVGIWNGFDAGAPASAPVTQPRTTVMSANKSLVVEFVTPYTK